MTLAALTLVGVLLCGVPLARILDARLRGAALAGTSFLLGAAAVVMHLFALSALHIPWTRTSVLLSLLPFLAITVFFARKLPAAATNRQPPTASRQRHLFDAATLIIVIAYAIFTISAPPFEWDFYGIWGLKGRMFFEACGIDWGFLSVNVSHPDYPLLMPLLFDFLAVVTGGWNDRVFGLVYVALCASVLAIARGFLEDEIRWPALGALAIAFPALNVWIGLAEAGVMAYGCAGLLFIRKGSIRTGAILLGLAAWSKNEGLALIGCSVIALFVATRSIRRVIALWPAVAVIAPWMITRALLQFHTDFMEGSVMSRVLERLAKPGEVLHAFIVSPPDQPWFWLAFLATILVFAWDAIRREAFLTIALLLQLGLMLGQALATRWDFGAHVSLTLNRLPHQVAPAAAFLAVVLLLRNFSRTASQS